MRRIAFARHRRRCSALPAGAAGGRRDPRGQDARDRRAGRDHQRRPTSRRAAARRPGSCTTRTWSTRTTSSSASSPRAGRAGRPLPRLARADRPLDRLGRVDHPRRPPAAAGSAQIARRQLRREDRRARRLAERARPHRLPAHRLRVRPARRPVGPGAALPGGLPPRGRPAAGQGRRQRRLRLALLGRVLPRRGLDRLDRPRLDRLRPRARAGSTRPSRASARSTPTRSTSRPSYPGREYVDFFAISYFGDACCFGESSPAARAVYHERTRQILAQARDIGLPSMIGESTPAYVGFGSDVGLDYLAKHFELVREFDLRATSMIVADWPRSTTASGIRCSGTATGRMRGSPRTGRRARRGLRSWTTRAVRRGG